LAARQGARYSSAPPPSGIWQTPATHTPAHGWLHAPQCAALPSVSASQPFEPSPSQSANGAVHAKPHDVPSHVADACAGEGHGVHDPPHDAVSSSLAQRSPLHRCDPDLHWTPHAPLEHVATPPGGAEQGLHDEPHVSGSAFDEHLLPQAWKPASQTNWQSLETHCACPFATIGHARWHDPQWLTLLVRSAHCLPHRVGASPGHPLTHWNAPLDGVQSGAAVPHAALHVPQWPGCDRSVSQPLPSSWSQSEKPATHDATAHAPPAHVAAPWAIEHAVHASAAHP